ncbi:protein mono-ADP-ribosyltransferase PARP9 [Hoplias malabaricus]|uniref:protein mono-ADP-ribosyltransferase PARP9 n=1 Tax=Hoplias malabaricus TaxID=27720 RepID=UPI0034621E22
MTATEKIPLIQEWTEILKESRFAFCEAVKGKFGCTPWIHNVDMTAASSFGSKIGTITPEIKYKKQMPNQLTISVWKDDLTTHKADAVVNAANEKLSHAGGLALALSMAGGPEIQKMSDQIIEAQGHVPTGEVVVTPAGKLPCNHIMHAVGPCLSQYPSQEDLKKASYLLEDVIWNILRLAEHYNLQSVAIPAISSGIFNFPRNVCANIIVNSVKSFNDKRTSRSLEIHLVNNDDPTVGEMLRACVTFLGPSDSQSGAMQTWSTASTKSVGSSLELGNVTLYLKKGSIEQETTHVIVNTIAHDLDLSKGYVSKAILEKAGQKIQDEIKKFSYKPVSDGSVIETKGYKLKCKAVYHTVCAIKSLSSSASQILHNVIIQCLEKAHSKSFTSISFPAIGTGNLGFQKEEVSEIMIHAVAEFAKKNTGSNLDVFFVIFPKDTDKFQAFEKAMDSFKRTDGPSKSTKGSFNSFTSKSSTFYDSDKAFSTTPYIDLLAESCEALREAKAWALRIMSTTTQFTINNQHVTQFGQEDHKKLMSLQTKFNVHITEFFRDGKCGITIIGDNIDVSCAALEVEAMLCKAQEDFAQAQEIDLLHSVVSWQAFPGSEEPEINAALEKAYLEGVDTKYFTVHGNNYKVDFKSKIVTSEQGGARFDRTSIFSLYSSLPSLESRSYYARTSNITESLRDRKKKFEKSGLKIMKVEKIENNALKQVFELKKRLVPGQPQYMYQRVQAQFCELICRVGFQRDYAPPEEQKWGAGIYFTKEVDKALKLWQDNEEEYVYIFEAEVITGRDTTGSSKLILPPTTKNDPLVHYDSVTSDRGDISVIFNGQQALPKFLVTCRKSNSSTPV